MASIPVDARFVFKLKLQFGRFLSQVSSNGWRMMGFYSCHKTDKKKLGVPMVLGDVVSALEMFVWILNHVSRSITWSLVTLKASDSVKRPLST